MTDEQLAELRRLERVATPGPWMAGTIRGMGNIASPLGLVCKMLGLHAFKSHNMDFIVASRNAAPDLLRAAEQLRRIVALARQTERIESSAVLALCEDSTAVLMPPLEGEGEG